MCCQTSPPNSSPSTDSCSTARSTRRRSLLSNLLPPLSTITSTRRNSGLAVFEALFSPSPASSSPKASPRSPPTESPTPIIKSIPPPTQPATPLPWLWQCHLCKATYRLSITRRCLEDGHYFCFAPPASTTPATPGKSPNANTTPKRKKRRSRRQESCASSFDYVGWAAHNTWRKAIARFNDRFVSVDDAEGSDKENDQTSRSARSRGSPMTAVDKLPENCWTDCNFPSECRHKRVELQRRESEAQQQMLAQQERERQHAAARCALENIAPLQYKSNKVGQQLDNSFAVELDSTELVTRKANDMAKESKALIETLLLELGEREKQLEFDLGFVVPRWDTARDLKAGGVEDGDVGDVKLIDLAG